MPKTRLPSPPLPQVFLGFFLSLFWVFHLCADPRPPLSADEAFSVQARFLASDRIEIRFKIAEGHYLYRDKLAFSIQGKGLKAEAVRLPKGSWKRDAYFGAIEVYRRHLSVVLPWSPGRESVSLIRLEVVYQGCSDQGLCFPPQRKRIELALSKETAGPFALTQGASSKTGRAGPAGPAEEESEGLARFLMRGNKLWTLLAFFGFGLLLSFTPCVFPMIPILSGIIVAQGQGLSRKKAVLLSLAYVLGMALAYSTAGVAAGLSGRMLAHIFQNPWVLISFALIFLVLALSMFGLFDLQVPVAIQNKLARLGYPLKGGGFLGVFLMGVLSAVIVGPCVTAPLAGALLYIGRTGDVLLGGTALFVLSLGMGIPLLVVGTSAGVLLPKAGGWMKGVKIFFGILLLVVALWIVRPLFWSPGSSSLPFERVTGLGEWEALLEKGSERPILLFVTADWCASCKEMERGTFQEAAIQSGLKTFRMVKADVTQGDQPARALLEKYGLYGPPAVLFFDPKGREIPATRVVGLKNTKEFLLDLEKVFLKLEKK